MQSFKMIWLLGYCLHACQMIGQINYNAHDFIPEYKGTFGFGINPGAHEGWLDQELADIAAGNDEKGIKGIGVTSFCLALPENFLEFWGYDIRENAFQHYSDLGMKEGLRYHGFTGRNLFFEN